MDQKWLKFGLCEYFGPFVGSFFGRWQKMTTDQPKFEVSNFGPNLGGLKKWDPSLKLGPAWGWARAVHFGMAHFGSISSHRSAQIGMAFSRVRENGPFWTAP